ncbi:hypothetical protein MNBD_GAMMA17-408 [hydrothermal vent metagenome]|uniref:Cytochrome c domain-containing protein n=1 Tax=hydrothermal vent metagenome TaxID=652676 RepID=A0A3B0Z6J2_9ZZZZ
MSPYRNLIIGSVLLLIGVVGLTTTGGSCYSMGSMMDRDGMKGMMKDMMGAQLPPGIDPGDLPEPQSNGAEHLGKYCTQCHEMPGPGMHTAEEWPRVVDRMNQRMQMMSGRSMMGMMHDIQAPEDYELEVLIAYLQNHAQKPIDKSQYEDLNSIAGQSFEAVCSQCHVLPDPKQHTVDEWPAVVQRMKQNMTIMGKFVPDDKAVEMILGFLQKHAR